MKKYKLVLTKPHRDVKYRIRNIVDKTVTTGHGARGTRLIGGIAS